MQRRVVIAGAARLPFARSHTAYAELDNLTMLTAVLRALVARCSLEGEILGDVVAGATIKHARDWNLARDATLASGLDPHTPAHDLQRACGTSLTAVADLAYRIGAGEIDSGIAGGVDTMSDVPLEFSSDLQRILIRAQRAKSLGAKLGALAKLRPRYLKPALPRVVEPLTGLSMGEHCELMAKEWDISRADQDRLALEGHIAAANAWAEGFFTDLVVAPFGLARDNNVRSDTSIEKLAKLPTVYDRGPDGTLTAGNSTPLTDGAAAVVLGSEDWVRERKLPVLAYLSHARTAAVDHAGLVGPREGLLMAHTYAVARLLERTGLRLQDFDFYEIHEAFSAEVLCTLKAWESDHYCRTKLGQQGPLGAIDRAKLNVKGGSVAIGHPFAATGARLVGTLAKLLAQRGGGRGLVTVCTAGGMGVAAILER
jgi:acetyl-CoA C-acetyltransferase